MRLAVLLVVTAVLGCAGRDAHGSAPALAAPDGGTKARAPKAPPPDAGATPAGEARPAKGQPAEAEGTDPEALVGLTRAQLRARRGPPTEVRGKTWVYTPDQPGCREEIVSEVVSFKGDVVASVKLQRTRTHKVCRRER